MKGRVLLAVTALSLSLSGCGGGSGSTITPPPPPPPPTHNIWTWMGGSNLIDQSATYGTPGTAAASNNPGARSSAVSRVDASGTLWLFGGANSSGNALNDLWKYSGGEWTWMSGSNVQNQPGVYGTMGTSSPNNIPGARYSASAWIDSSGAIWLFGGMGFDSTGAPGNLNDLWKYSSGQWTWVGGSNLTNQFGGVYGTEGVASPSNIPPARNSAVSWVDASGNFWLFGGNSASVRNDLWEYSSGEWTWVSGSDTGNQAGVYGTFGVPSPGNAPGNRINSSGWIDASGNLWMFGGWGIDLTQPYPNLGIFNDLWRYSAGEWAWMSGANISDQSGVYGTQGKSGSGDVPGARQSAATWIDASGNLWLFGGGYDEFLLGHNLYFNDLWKYSGGQWTWIGGANTIDASGSYGTQAQASSTNVPGARSDAVSWTDASGNVWIFGGYGHDSTGTVGALNDLWKYQP